MAALSPLAVTGSSPALVSTDSLQKDRGKVLPERASSPKAEATQNLSSFNLDFVGLNVRSIKVEGDPATWTRNGDELKVKLAEKAGISRARQDAYDRRPADWSKSTTSPTGPRAEGHWVQAAGH